MIKIILIQASALYLLYLMAIPVFDKADDAFSPNKIGFILISELALVISFSLLNYFLSGRELKTFVMMSFVSLISLSFFAWKITLSWESSFRWLPIPFDKFLVSMIDCLSISLFLSIQVFMALKLRTRVKKLK